MNKNNNKFSLKEKVINTFVSISHKQDHDKINFNYNKKLSVNDIWNVSMHSADIKNKEILNKILSNKNYSKIFYNFFKKQSELHMPQSIAASSNIKNRKANDFEIHLNQSNKDNEIIYLKIIVKKKIDKTLKNLYVGKDNNFESIDLPKIIDKQAQIMIKKSDKIYQMVVDPDTEIFIR